MFLQISGWTFMEPEKPGVWYEKYCKNKLFTEADISMIAGSIFNDLGRHEFGGPRDGFENLYFCHCYLEAPPDPVYWPVGL